jgi:hypothetical protein
MPSDAIIPDKPQLKGNYLYEGMKRLEAAVPIVCRPDDEGPPILIVVGPTNIGKTFTITRTGYRLGIMLEEHTADSSTALFMILRDNPNRVVFLDDNGNLLNVPASVSILKKHTEVPRRTVSHEVYGKMDDHWRYQASAKVIISDNYRLERSKSGDIAALLRRAKGCYIALFLATELEVVQYTLAFAQEIFDARGYPLKVCNDAIEYYWQHLSVIRELGPGTLGDIGDMRFLSPDKWRDLCEGFLYRQKPKERPEWGLDVLPMMPVLDSVKQRPPTVSHAVRPSERRLRPVPTRKPADGRSPLLPPMPRPAHTVQEPPKPELKDEAGKPNGEAKPRRRIKRAE